MKKFLTMTAMLLVAFSLTACGGDQKDHDHKDHDHKDHDHKDHDHKDHKDEHKDHGQKDDDHEGEAIDLGKVDVDGVSIGVTLFGEVKSGSEVAFDVKVTGVTPVAVRGWVGVASAQGSAKARLDEEGDHYHGHCLAPEPLPAGSELWIEVETTDGDRISAAFGLK